MVAFIATATRAMIRKFRESPTRTNAQCLLDFIGDGGEFTSTQVVMAGLMSAEEVHAALKYAVRHELLVMTKYSGTSARDRFRYRPSGKSLSDEDVGVVAPSFDSLLGVWGIAHVRTATGGLAEVSVSGKPRVRVLLND